LYLVSCSTDRWKGKIASLPGSRTKKEKVPTAKAPKKVLKPGPNGWTIISTESPNATMVSLSGSSSSSESEEESEYESESGDDAEAEEPSPLPATRPDDPVARVKYDTTKVVWSPRNRVPQAERIGNALTAYSELVKCFREAWRSDTAKLKEAEEKKEQSLLRKCKSAVNQKRVFMETALKTTLESGHPAIIKRYVQGNFPFFCYFILRICGGEGIQGRCRTAAGHIMDSPLLSKLSIRIIIKVLGSRPDCWRCWAVFKGLFAGVMIKQRLLSINAALWLSLRRPLPTIPDVCVDCFPVSKLCFVRLV
jgi:hypothetical protein